MGTGRQRAQEEGQDRKAQTNRTSLMGLGQVFDLIFGQGFDQGFGEEKKPQIQCTVLPSLRKTFQKLQKTQQKSLKL